MMPGIPPPCAGAQRPPPSISAPKRAHQSIRQDGRPSFWKHSFNGGRAHWCFRWAMQGNMQPARWFGRWQPSHPAARCGHVRAAAGGRARRGRPCRHIPNEGLRAETFSCTSLLQSSAVDLGPAPETKPARQPAGGRGMGFLGTVWVGGWRLWLAGWRYSSCAWCVWCCVSAFLHSCISSALSVSRPTASTRPPWKLGVLHRDAPLSRPSLVGLPQRGCGPE